MHQDVDLDDSEPINNHQNCWLPKCGNQIIYGENIKSHGYDRTICSKEGNELGRATSYSGCVKLSWNTLKHNKQTCFQKEVKKRACAKLLFMCYCAKLVQFSVESVSFSFLPFWIFSSVSFSSTLIFLLHHIFKQKLVLGPQFLSLYWIECCHVK